MRNTLKILLIRNDKLGDFALALPTFQTLKSAIPDAELYALVPAYTAPIAELCPAIDHVIIDPTAKATGSEQSKLIKVLKAHQFDAALTLFSTNRTAWLLARAGIRNRIAPASKWAQLLYPHRVKQQRSRSIKPEYQYNLDLLPKLYALLNRSASSTAKTPKPPYLTLNTQSQQAAKQNLLTTHKIPEDHALIFIHPGSGGSASNLTIDQFATLAHQIYLGLQKRNASQANKIAFVITAGPDEGTVAQSLQKKMHSLSTHLPSDILHSTEGLIRFTEYLSLASIFISGSTGPLHIAAALNRPNIGFYPNLKTASSLRWQTISDADKRLSFSPQAAGNLPNAMATLDMIPIAEKIIDQFF